MPSKTSKDFESEYRKYRQNRNKQEKERRGKIRPHINKKTYTTSKEVVLEPKGIEIVKKSVAKFISKD